MGMNSAFTVTMVTMGTLLYIEYLD